MHTVGVAVCGITNRQGPTSAAPVVLRHGQEPVCIHPHLWHAIKKVNPQALERTTTRLHVLCPPQVVLCQCRAVQLSHLSVAGRTRCREAAHLRHCLCVRPVRECRPTTIIPLRQWVLWPSCADQNSQQPNRQTTKQNTD